jgi:hypothetical protein
MIGASVSALGRRVRRPFVTLGVAPGCHAPTPGTRFARLFGCWPLKGALKAIKVAFGDGEMPFVKAMTTPTNARSQKLLDHHCFEELGLGPMGQQFHVIRLPGVGLGKTRALTWAPYEP